MDTFLMWVFIVASLIIVAREIRDHERMRERDEDWFNNQW